MSAVIEQLTLGPTRATQNIQAAEIARDLALMDDLETFVQSLPKRTEGRNPTTQEMREMAYEEREANSL